MLIKNKITMMMLNFYDADVDFSSHANLRSV